MFLQDGLQNLILLMINMDGQIGVVFGSIQMANMELKTTNYIYMRF
jgi:hypothetical protein